MALRIKMGGPAAGASTPMPQPEIQLQNAAPDMDPDAGADAGDPTQDPDAAGDSGGDDSNKIPQANAGYQGPDQGPFICANCQFFSDGTCAVVAGPVDHMGCCNNFTSLSGQQGEDQGSDDGGNTVGDQSNSEPSATDQPIGTQDSSENS
jgi:hypothetical protein